MNRSRLLLLSVIHGFVHGTMNIFPVVLPAVRESFGWSVSTIGWVGTLGYVLFGGMALPAGWIADVFDRDRLINLMISGMALSLLTVGLWTTTTGFLVSWSLVCLFAGLYHPLGLSSVVTVGGDNTGRAMGWHGFGGNLGFAIMPVVAGVITAGYGWPSAFMASAVAGGLLSLSAVVLPRTDHEGDGSSRESFPWSRALILVLLLYGLVGFVYRGMVTFIPTSFLERWSSGIDLGEVGLLTTVIYVVGALGQLGGGWLEERFDSLKLFGLVTAGHVLAVVGLSVSAGRAFFGLLMIWALLYFAGQPILNTLVSRVGYRSNHGRLYGAAFTMNLGLGASGAGVTGSLIEIGGLNAGYLGVVLGGVAALSILLILVGQNIKSSTGPS